MESIKQFLGFKNDNATMMEQFENHLPFMSYKQKMIGFTSCLIIAFLIIIISLMGIGFSFMSNGLFAIFYTIANLLLFISTIFLMGFIKQLKKMLLKIRIISVLIFIIAMIMTFVSVFKYHNSLLAFFFVIIQLFSYAYYSITYIPGGISCIKSSCFSCV